MAEEEEGGEEKKWRICLDFYLGPVVGRRGAAKHGMDKITWEMS